jgi:hypothetical protein
MVIQPYPYCLLQNRFSQYFQYILTENFPNLQMFLFCLTVHFRIYLSPFTFYHKQTGGTNLFLQHFCLKYFLCFIACKFSLPQNTKPQFIQVLCHLIARIVFPTFPSETSPESPVMPSLSFRTLPASLITQF